MINGKQKIEKRMYFRKRKWKLYINIFQKIDEFGHITNVNWFLDLDRPRLIKLLREFIDIWDYRASLTLHTKRDICPPNGNPFIGINLKEKNGEPINKKA